MNRDIFLLLGSNQGDAAMNLATARAAIARDAGRIEQTSALYKSAAWGLHEQPDFLNQVLQLVSPLAPGELLTVVLDIERQMGRIRRQRWGPRIIDIDVLLYGNEVIHTERLRVPHPGIPERRFTLEPLAEIAPGLIHPVLGTSMASLLAACSDPLTVERLAEDQSE